MIHVISQVRQVMLQYLKYGFLIFFKMKGFINETVFKQEYALTPSSGCPL